jgi:hypothetical protein
VYTESSSTEAGSRFFLSYTGSAPTAANCATLASDVATAWNTNLAPLPSQNWALTEVDVLDIATDTGLSGVWNGTHTASGGTVPLPKNNAVNIEYDIARRYRGGKPRMFLPAGNQTQLVDMGHWNNSFVTSVNTGIAAFFAEIEALSIGAIGTLAHVNLSYYKGFTNITNSSGRERAVPTYRTAALSSPVTNYACKAEVGSQRRRRLATTP